MKYFLLALSVIVGLAACNPSPKVTPSRENLMRAKRWKISGGTLRVKKPDGKDTTLKYVDFLPDCYKDDYLKFDSLHFGKQYINGTSCNTYDPEFEGFTWRLWNNDKYIDLYDGFNRIFCVATTIQPWYIPEFSSDTVRELRYTRYAIPEFDIYGAEITEFTSTSFKLNFSFKTTRLDSTSWHSGIPNSNPPIVLDDTAHYSLIYTGY